jgi:Superinfection immunity protein
MSLLNNLKKKFTDFMEWILVDRDSEMSHLEFQREVRKRKREKAAAKAVGDKRSDLKSLLPPQKGDTMLRTIAISFAQALAIVLSAEVCWSSVSFCLDKYSFTIGPLLILVLYPLPIFVANWRKHKAVLDIMVMNVWLGWNVVGWLVALIWACDWDVEEVAA